MNHTTDTDPIDELRHAASVIHRATHGTWPTNPVAIATAHNTLARHRHVTGGLLREAIDHYLAEDTWQQGPLPVIRALTSLTWQLGVEPATDISEQPTLFN